MKNMTNESLLVDDIENGKEVHIQMINGLITSLVAAIQSMTISLGLVEASMSICMNIISFSRVLRQGFIAIHYLVSLAFKVLQDVIPFKKSTPCVS
jgi:hypothetical protein